MKKLYLIFVLLVLGSVARTEPINPNDLIPHLDKAFYFMPEIRVNMVSDISAIMSSFCAMAAGRTDKDNIDQAALESCEFSRVVRGLEDSERELQLKNGEPFMARLERGAVDETAMWRYFVRTQEVRRVLSSLRIYLSHSADLQGAGVGMMTIPLLAGGLDNYSYWTRLIAMRDNQTCPVDNSQYCQLIQPQLASLAARAWRAVVADPISLDDKTANLLRLSSAINARLKKMTLAELAQLETMADATSAGEGIPYCRQLAQHFNLAVPDLSKTSQKQIHAAIVLDEIRDAIARWGVPDHFVEVYSESLSTLTTELRAIVTNGRSL